jgi:hypothetical protein
MPTTTQQLIWIFEDSPVAAGEIKTIKQTNKDGWFITVDKNLIDPHWCCPVGDWEIYNGGYALFSQETGELVAEKDIKKYLVTQGGWTSEVLISMVLSPLRTDLVKQWLRENSGTLVESREVRDGREWRVQVANGDSNDNGSQKVANGDSNDNGSQKVANGDSNINALGNAETLQDFEQLIRDNLLGFYTVGRALIEIRDRQLYIDLPDINTFEEYCQSPLTLLRLGIGSKGRAYDLINAAGVITILKKSPLATLPKNERQIRPLVRGKLNELQIVDAWNEAIEQAPSGKEPTGAVVKDAVRQIKERDRERLAIPNPYSEGDVLRFNSNGDPVTRDRNKRWVVVGEVQEFTCIVWDFEGDFLAHINQLERLEVSEEERTNAPKLRDRLSKIDTSEPLAKMNVNYFSKLERISLSDFEEAILKTLEEKNEH